MKKVFSYFTLAICLMISVGFLTGCTIGVNGDNGSAGKSAYELAVDSGFEGTLEEWLKSLNGANGEDGANGADGTNYSDILAGKKMLVTGDSITDKTDRASTNWHDYLKNWLKLSTVYNDGKSGTGIVRPFQGNSGMYDRADSWKTTYGNDFDGIVIMGNMNDIYKDVPLESFSLGQFGDKVLTTQYGAVTLFIEKLLTLFPNKSILWVTSAPRTIYGRAEVNPTQQGWGIEAEFEKYNEAILRVCANYSIPALDLYHSSGLRPWLPENNKTYFSTASNPEGDGVHPNDLGQNVLAKKILPFVLQYFNTDSITNGGVPTQSFSITKNLTNTTINNNINSINGGERYNATLSANSGFTLSKVTVFMNNINVTSQVYSNGAIDIENVAGNIVINAISIDGQSKLTTWGGPTKYDCFVVSSIDELVYVDGTTRLYSDHEFMLITNSDSYGRAISAGTILAVNGAETIGLSTNAPLNHKFAVVEFLSIPGSYDKIINTSTYAWLTNDYKLSSNTRFVLILLYSGIDTQWTSDSLEKANTFVEFK